MAEAMLDGLAAMLRDWLGPVEDRGRHGQISELAEDRAKLWEQVGAADFSAATRSGAAGFEPEGAMTGEALLAELMAQAEGRGVDLITLRALVEEASQAGAARALARSGSTTAGAAATWTNCASCCRPGATPSAARGRRW
jgi:hypothetical protein